MARGGKREGAGRPPGGNNQGKLDLAELARTHTQSALDVLIAIMQNPAEVAAARVSSANIILDRGYGKAPQLLDLSNKDGTLSRPQTILLRGPDDNSDPSDTTQADTDIHGQG